MRAVKIRHTRGQSAGKSITDPSETTRRVSRWKGICMMLTPQWVCGFVDGEGTFFVGINKNPTMKIGYQVLPEFRIVQHKKDIKLLHALKSFFKSGVVRVNHDDRFELRIRKMEALEKTVIPFFKTNQLQTQKRFDFLKFSEVVRLMNDGAHLNVDGIIRIIDVASGMNRADKKKALEIKRELELKRG
jgi:hypothetical protein